MNTNAVFHEAHFPINLLNEGSNINNEKYTQKKGMR